MKVCRNILFILIAALMAACGPSRESRGLLDRAEALVRTQPDSALAILDSINLKELDNARFLAQLTVAKAEACYKSRRPLPSDSVFDTTITVLSQRNPDTYLMRAYFLNGYRKISDERYIEAIVDLLSAEEIANRLGDAHFAGLSQRNIADAFDRMDDHASALAYYKKSAGTFKADPDSSYYYWGLYNVARSNNNIGDYRASLKLSDSLAKIDHVKDNHILYSAVLRNLAIAKLNNNQSEEALMLFSELGRDGKLSPLDFYNMGRAYLNIGLIAEAKACSDSVKAFDSTDTSLDFSIACATKDNANIYNLIRSDLKNTNHEFESIYKRNYAEVIDRFYKQTAGKRKEELRRSRLQLYIFAFIAIIIFICISGVVYTLIKRKESRIRVTLSLVAELSETVNTQSDNISKLRSELAEGSTRQETYRLDARKHLISKIEAFNEVCDVYSDSTDDPKQLFRRILSFIAKNATKKNIEEIQQYLNEYFDGIIRRFTVDFPNLNQNEIALFTLSAAGFKAPAIALYLHTEVKNIYSRKYKLKQKMLKCSPQAADKYIAYLN